MWALPTPTKGHGPFDPDYLKNSICWFSHIVNQQPNEY